MTFILNVVGKMMLYVCMYVCRNERPSYSDFDNQLKID
jgi:hypothetical protein